MSSTIYIYIAITCIACFITSTIVGTICYYRGSSNGYSDGIRARQAINRRHRNKNHKKNGNHFKG